MTPEEKNKVLRLIKSILEETSHVIRSNMDTIILDAINDSEIDIDGEFPDPEETQK